MNAQPVSTPVRPRIDISRSRALARFTDDLVKVPGTNFGVGADSVIGLLPGIGDVLGTTMSAVILSDAVRARVPIPTLARMGWNIILDAGLGLVPFAGDIADVAHRANRKNYRLLEAAVERNPYPEAPSAGYLVSAVFLFIAPLLIAIALSVLAIWMLIKVLRGL